MLPSRVYTPLCCLTFVSVTSRVFWFRFGNPVDTLQDSSGSNGKQRRQPRTQLPGGDERGDQGVGGMLARLKSIPSRVEMEQQAWLTGQACCSELASRLPTAPQPIGSNAVSF